jgi:di/tricarboxylate transporter
MTTTGAAAWLRQLLAGRVRGFADAPVMLLVGLVMAVVVVHLAIGNLTACVALLPINATIAARAGPSPALVGLANLIAVDAVIFYPVQTAANLMAYETGCFDRAYVMKLGLGMLAANVMVVVLVLPYWTLLGFALTAR